VYGLETDGGSTALVLELIEGETLAEQIASGPIPLDEALAIARQIAEALEAAHERGIIHRDLKPANIKITPDGRVKVLDFGLAKMLEREASNSTLSMSPTLSVQATYAGVILGTAAYMSPEQARGKPVDRRTDIWAFGCVLFEMLTGKKTFDAGDTVSDAVAAILRSDPDWNALPSDTPAHIRALLRRCLQKDPHKRLPHIGVARLEIDEVPAPQPLAGQQVSGKSASARWSRAVPFAVVAVLAGVVAATIALKVKQAPAGRPTRLTLQVPDGPRFTSQNRQALGISPDGTHVAYSTLAGLYVRAMSEFDAKLVLATSVTDARAVIQQPVFSPDGQWIAFATGENLIRKVSVNGGAVITICQANPTYGMSWSGNSILFGQSGTGVMRVSEDGGTPEQLLKVKLGEVVYGPQMLPDGDHLLVTISQGGGSDQWDRARIVIHSVSTGKQDVVVTGGADARYVQTGHLVYALGGTLFAVAFDLGQFKTHGGTIPILEGVARTALGTTGAANYSFSTTGTLVYLAGPASATPGGLIALTDRRGGIDVLKLPQGPYEYPRVSPNGKQIAFGTDDGKEATVSLYDLAGTSSTRRLTFGGKNRFPIWSPDGTYIAFQSDREGDAGIWWQRADGTGTAQRLTKAEQGAQHFPESWSPNGEMLLFSAVKDWVATLQAVSLKSQVVTRVGDIRSTNNLIASTLSPDGKWLAYTANDTGLTGENNVFVEAFPPTGAKYQISKKGENGHLPLWSRDGKELYYVPQVGQLVVVSVTPAPVFSFSDPISVPRRFQRAAPTTPRVFDVTPDGKIVAVVPAGATEDTGQTPDIQVWLNWFEELKQRVPIE
jgi:Tol biopolymer transport system component